MPLNFPSTLLNSQLLFLVLFSKLLSSPSHEHVLTPKKFKFSFLFDDMRIFFKYASVLNLASIADQVVGLALASGDLNNFDSDRGFGHIFKWRTLNDAFHEAKVTRKPIFLVIHRPWCPACKKLKVNFEKSIKLLDLSKQYVEFYSSHLVKFSCSHKIFISFYKVCIPLQKMMNYFILSSVSSW